MSELFHRPGLLGRLIRNPTLAEHAFGLRLGASLLATFLVASVACVLLLEHNLAEKQIHDFGTAQRVNVGSFEQVGGVRNKATSLRNIDLLLDSIERRADAKEAILIDQRHVVVAAATPNDRQLSKRVTNPAVVAALTHGATFEGRETDPGTDHRDFEFVLPVRLPSGRYAYDVTFQQSAFEQQLAQVRHILLWIDLLGILGGCVLFYLFGGHRLLRDHQLALRRATRDGLTDLPNHRAFSDEVLLAVASAERHDAPLALAMIDVDDFKRANDRFGHAHGDAVLKRVASELRRGRPGDRAFRIGGDEFAVILTDTDDDGARELAQRMREHLAANGIAISIGLSPFRRGLRADTLCAEADSALYEAKRQGGDQAVHVADIYEGVRVTSSEKKEAVRRLIEERRITTTFQPIWNLQTGALLGVEALSRPDPDFGLTGPAEAFNVAEEIGRVHALDLLCVESALLLVPPLPPDALLFVNLSPLTLDLDASAPNWIAPLVERAGLSPEDVVIEVTERFGGRIEAVLRRLARLREQGFKIAIDDVGTGN
jgi:diguanylate cyclase (GGDEF)-like protein